MDGTRFYPGTTDPRVSPREIAHRELARRAAAEGMVLLENDGVLPLAAGARVALYGFGARHTIKGGTGSGCVNNRQNVSVDQGLRENGFVICNDDWLDDYDRRYEQASRDWEQGILERTGTPIQFMKLYYEHSSHPMQAPARLPVTAGSKADADTAVYVLSRVSGEGADRKAAKGDYYLSDEEYADLGNICAVYPKTIVVLNTGGSVDLAFLDELKPAAVVYMSQAGMEGGNALADVLSGRVCPSGRLTDT